MLKDLIKKENEFASQIIVSYEEEIKKTEQDISYIDDKYKKLAEEEKKSLNAELAELKNRLSQWKASVVSEVSEGDETKTEEEPKITDTLFPENNEPELTPEEVPAVEIPKEELEEDFKAFNESDEVKTLEESEFKTDDDGWGEPKDWD